jgi:hypothetical protein
MLGLSYTPLVFMSQVPLRGFTGSVICGTNIVPGARLLLPLSPLLPQRRAPVLPPQRYQREYHAQPFFKQALHRLTSFHRPRQAPYPAPLCFTVSPTCPLAYNAERMGTRMFILAALLALVVGVTGRITYERVVNTATPAYAQDEDPTVGRDCDDFRSQAEAQAALREDPSDPDVLDEDEGPDDGIACETTNYDDQTTDLTPVAAAVGDGGSASPAPTTTSSPAPTTSSPAPSDTGASQDQYVDGNVERPGDMLNSGASGPGPVLTLPDGSCLPEYPIKRNGYCYR